MNEDTFLKLRDQMLEMENLETGWESEKSTFQSKIASLQQEENQWLNLKAVLLSRLRILQEAMSESPQKRQEILLELPNYDPAIQISKIAESQNKSKTQNEETEQQSPNKKVDNPKSNALPKPPLVVPKSPPAMLPSRVRKSPGKDNKRRKSLNVKATSGSSHDSSMANGNILYNHKWSLSQHLDCVRCAAFHPTLPYIATGSDDGSIRISNLDPQKKTKSKNPIQLLSLRGHSGPILSLAAYHNYLISGDVYGQICVWDFSETKSSMNESHGRVDHHLIYYTNDHTDSVWSIATHENVSYFITASSDKTIRINDIETHQSTPISIPDGPTVVSFNSDGSLFIVGCINGHIHIFENKQDIGDIDLHSYVFSICHSDKKNEIFVACEDKSIKLFDLTSKNVIKQIIAHELYTSAMTLTSDDHFLVTTSPDKTIRIWSLPDLDVVSVDSHHREKYGEAGLCMAATLKTNPHEYFASGGADGVVKIFAKNK